MKTLNHHCFEAVSDIKQICGDYFSDNKLKFFGHIRVYDHDKFFCLNNDNKWPTWLFVENNYPPAGYLTFDQVQDGVYFPSMSTEHPIFGWEKEIVIFTRDNFDIHNPIIITKKYDDFYESFCITTNCENPYDDFISNINDYKKFISYYRDKSRKIIAKADTNTFKILDKYKVKRQKMKMKNISDDKLLAEESISSPRKYDLYYNKKFRPITAREFESLELISQGKSAKVAANELGVSPRTIETYLNNIKMKFDISSKHELSQLYWDNKFLIV